MLTLCSTQSTFLPSLQSMLVSLLRVCVTWSWPHPQWDSSCHLELATPTVGLFVSPGVGHTHVGLFVSPGVGHTHSGTLRVTWSWPHPQWDSSCNLELATPTVGRGGVGHTHSGTLRVTLPGGKHILCTVMLASLPAPVQVFITFCTHDNNLGRGPWKQA